MKKTKLWKVIWIIGVYAILAAILYLVVLYKVEWEDRDFNTYLYFYACNDNVCTSTTKQDDYYSKFICEDGVCPYITHIIDENLVLKKNNVSLIYNYITGRIINDVYTDYRYIGDGKFVFTDSSLKQGIINLEGEILVNAQYEYIDDYKDGFVVYRENNFYGIDTEDKNVMVDANFEKIVLINNKIYAGMKDNIYHIYSYADGNYFSSQEYDFVASFDDILFVVNNKKIDILTTDLNSTLLMKIATFYEYKTEKERSSLNLYRDREHIYFKVFTSETEYTSYQYLIASKKLI